MNAISGVRSSLWRTADCFIPFSNPTCYQCVRWGRKPRWIPTAPSKLFKIPERKKYPADETAEVIRLNNIYRTQLKSLRKYFADKTQSMTTAPEIIEEQLRKEEEHHLKCVEENKRWNAEVAELRKVRLLNEEKIRREKIMNELIEYEKEQQKILEETEALVRQEKENSKYFITESNVDEAIEKALANEVDYNYAIDLEGNVFEGRKTKPIKPKPTEEIDKARMQASN